MKANKKSRRKQLGRIYYGPEGHETSIWWTVGVTDAKKGVTINGTAAAALRAHRGVTVGCALSLTGMDCAQQFGHPVYLVSVTKSTLMAVDKLAKDGSPCHAVRYGHNYGDIVDRNDDGSLKKMVAARPEIIERPFNLRPPRKRPTGPHKESHAKHGGATHTRSYRQQHGALARAVKAGRIGKHVAQQLSRAMSRQRRPTMDVPPAEMREAEKVI